MKEKLKRTLKAKFTGEYIEPTNKERSLIILIVGFSVIFALLLYVRISNNNVNNENNTPVQNQESNNKYMTLDKLFEKYNTSYKYSITVEDNTTKVLYEGSVSDKVDNGKKVVDNKEIEYHIVNDIAIDLNTNKEITDLYNNYLSYFFIPSNIYDFIKDKEKSEDIVDNKKIYIYNSIYNDSDIMFKVVSGKDKLEEIVYKYNKINYSIKLK